ncbi:hypothetical protein GCM10027064_25760 [Microbacterium petrolearium]
MARKNYTDEFRRRAVDLFESTPGATLKGIAGDLGISRDALKEWVERLGSGTTTAGSQRRSSSAGRPESQAARIVRLEAELAASQAERVKLETERDMADSTGGRNEFCELLRWCQIAERFAWSSVERVLDRGQLSAGDDAQIGALRQVLA